MTGMEKNKRRALIVRRHRVMLAREARERDPVPPPQQSNEEETIGEPVDTDYLVDNLPDLG